MRRLYRLYGIVIYLLAYTISWVLWQAGVKHIRRAFRTSYAHIEQHDLKVRARDAVKGGFHLLK